jgi:large subunit ribosomal protein L30e
MVENEIKNAMKSGKLLVGSKSVLKGIKRDDVKYVIYANNCKEDIVDMLKFYNKNFGIEIKKFNGNSRRLGEICGKPFNIMVLGIKK